jgi:hypothetical protein
MLRFVADQMDRLRGKNPEITLKQVCWAMDRRCGIWLTDWRKTSE